MCTESGAEQARQYAETIAKISGDPYYEYLYPALDEVVAWMDEMWIMKNSGADWEDWEEYEEWDKSTENWTDEDWENWEKQHEGEEEK